MTSSSSEEFDLLNPEISCRKLVNLTVEHADGTSEVIPAGGVALDAGANVAFVIADDDDEITVEVEPGVGGEDPYYRDKFNGLASLQGGETVSGAGDDGGKPDWLFTDQVLYITRVNGVFSEAFSGTLFILGDACSTLGEFEAAAGPGYPEEPSTCPIVEGESSAEGSSEVACAAALTILDVCTPCIDCLQYYRIEEFLDRIRTFYDYIFELSYDNQTTTIPEHPDGGVQEEFTGVLQQFMSSLRYWDFLLHNSTIKLSAQAFGQSVVAAAFYRNISDFTVGDGVDGVTLTFLFTFQKVDSGGTASDWDGVTASISDVIVLDRQGRCSADLGGSGVTYPSDNEVMVVTTSGIDLVSGAEIYSDVAVVLLNTALSNDPAFTYRVLVDLTVSHTHLGPEVSDNPVGRSEIVYFRPPDPEPSA